jgi:plastocyanin
MLGIDGPRRVAVALCGAAAALLAGCGGTNQFTLGHGGSMPGVGSADWDTGATVGATVRVGAGDPQPQRVVIANGQAVHWVDQGQTGHVIVLQFEQLDSPALHSGDTWDVQFTRSGEYRYQFAVVGGARSSGVVVVGSG